MIEPLLLVQMHSPSKQEQCVLNKYADRVLFEVIKVQIVVNNHSHRGEGYGVSARCGSNDKLELRSGHTMECM